MTEKIFADGVKIDAKQTQYGEIIKLGIKADKFIDFLAKYTNDRGYVNLDLKKGQKGNYYLELNTYKSDVVSNQAENEEVVQFGEFEEIPF